MKQKILNSFFLLLAVLSAICILADYIAAYTGSTEAVRWFMAFCSSLPYVALAAVAYSNVREQRDIWTGLQSVMAVYAICRTWLVRRVYLYAFGYTPTSFVVSLYRFAGAVLLALIWFALQKKEKRAWRIYVIVISAVFVVGTAGTLFWNDIVYEEGNPIIPGADFFFFLYVGSAALALNKKQKFLQYGSKRVCGDPIKLETESGEKIDGEILDYFQYDGRRMIVLLPNGEEQVIVLEEVMENFSVTFHALENDVLQNEVFDAFRSRNKEKEDAVS